MDLHAARLPKVTQKKQRKLKPSGDIFAGNTVLAPLLRNRENRISLQRDPDRNTIKNVDFYAGAGATPEIYPPYKSGGGPVKKVRFDKVRFKGNILKEVHSWGAGHVFAHRLGTSPSPSR